MPELPEVETVRRGLSPILSGKRIKKIEVLHPRAIRSTSKLPLQAATGARINAVERRGKFLWFRLNRDFALVGHLGMSGQMLITPKKSPLQKHARARIDYGDRKYELRFIDQRTFGWLSVDPLIDNEDIVLPEPCSHIAPDIFSIQFDKKTTIAKIKRSNAQIKKVLLNQEIMSGVGNIYADEALWYSQIHPERIASTLSERELADILRSVKRVMNRAVRAGGTSFDDLYINVNGESGYFEVSLRAYGREDEPCSRCGTPIRRIAFANRSSHFCPSCQKVRRSRSALAKSRRKRAVNS